MILWFRHLPEADLDIMEWKPFISNDWFRHHFMKFVYLLMAVSFLAPSWLGENLALTNFPLIPIILVIFIVHEALHIVVIKNKGDISLTFRGIFFWMNTNAILSKMRFWIFMSLPFIALSVVPLIISFFVSGDIKSLLLFISWVNLIISSSDIINSVLILIKPNKTVYCRGYYREL
ncbi:DUF3267 domain-containing protein [Paenibacillus radicis (ex Gao et al. 2016)]|uniref:DUF3267 domain-containing protein n=1 Tax=Paenibacillus radicis (ex Gao et al. 2016) TaxID=1737354 RepID=A0A917MB32_9BACL|nr:DUF3267 domain-containing protein [Paenibacillus radicis (ex Gao et al. 2016)]GGG88742.1 hypothetical protein GCM10010918_54220 [Paenibacillus radicis (ex Gao et al. 2016)]